MSATKTKTNDTDLNELTPEQAEARLREAEEHLTELEEAVSSGRDLSAEGSINDAEAAVLSARRILQGVRARARRERFDRWVERVEETKATIRDECEEARGQVGSALTELTEAASNAVDALAQRNSRAVAHRAKATSLEGAVADLAEDFNVQGHVHTAKTLVEDEIALLPAVLSRVLEALDGHDQSVFGPASNGASEFFQEIREYVDKSLAADTYTRDHLN